MSEDTGLRDIIRDIKAIVELEKESGVDEVIFKGINRQKPSSSSDVEYASLDNATLLAQLCRHAQDCQECGLHRSRRNLVFGAGDPQAQLMFIGEAPGLEEDIKGEPFVGKAGALLTKIIEAIGLKREDVYIANCLKCRPPQNRNPLPSEVISCREFLIRQIKIVRPKVICCLGKFASQTLLMSEEPISRLRGRSSDFEGIRVMPTFHPAYILRNPADKRLVWEDMKKVRDILQRKESQ